MKEGRNKNEASEMRESEGEKEDEIVASEDRDMPGTNEPGSTGQGVCINREYNQETEVKKLREELENQKIHIRTIEGELHRQKKINAPPTKEKFNNGKEIWQHFHKRSNESYRQEE
ncbi:hypothetical protein GOODEAATRI_003300 [Goodea atripinnis]|uniref:Uncharacterized protein n=1 Tax=Goodea atripinnis TaxID=208336 RepID=A0ABV0N9Y8_9TELE